MLVLPRLGVVRSHGVDHTLERVRERAVPQVVAETRNLNAQHVNIGDIDVRVVSVHLPRRDGLLQHALQNAGRAGRKWMNIVLIRGKLD